uniref:Uncharacterized protein n=1 Tax=Oryza sativa subsp. japonica TaxID=39947 RepID=Q33AG9_ORYSJ|nr:hypothetical protein LOC_Os10g10160 [Oryza sativa Japonica Group]
MAWSHMLLPGGQGFYGSMFHVPRFCYILSYHCNLAKRRQLGKIANLAPVPIEQPQFDRVPADRKSFSSSCCTDHMGCHHPGIDDENNEHVIGIERHPVNGYILTLRHGALADVIFDHIQTLDLEGRLLIAIHRYNHGIIRGTMCPCSRIIALGFLYFSLDCKICMINFLLFKGHEQNESQISLLCFQGNHFWK